MTTVFHRQFFVQTITLLVLIFGWTIFGYAQSDNYYDFDDSNPFEHRQLSFTTLDSNKIKSILPKINIQKTNVICYSDSFEADIIRLAYSTKNKNIWTTFATPFRNCTWDYKLINIDNKGEPEIVVKGNIIYEGWSRGEYHNDAILIYNIDSVPTQIFKLFYYCNEFNVGGPPTNEGAYDITTERKIIIENGTLKIEKFVPNLFDENGEMVTDDKCHITDIGEGTYKLINGQFTRQ